MGDFSYAACMAPGERDSLCLPVRLMYNRYKTNRKRDGNEYRNFFTYVRGPSDGAANCRRYAGRRTFAAACRTRQRQDDRHCAAGGVYDAVRGDSGPADSDAYVFPRGGGGNARALRGAVRYKEYAAVFHHTQLLRTDTAPLPRRTHDRGAGAGQAAAYALLQK
jgi:hypothetical protein